MALRKVLYTISALLMVASIYMYYVMARDNASMQAPPISILADENKEKAVKNNPYVIRHGSNAMPEGMGQEDKPEFMPQWQKDKIKDSRGDPYVGSAEADKDSAPPAKEEKSQPSAQDAMNDLLNSIPE